MVLVPLILTDEGSPESSPRPCSESWRPSVSRSRLSPGVGKRSSDAVDELWSLFGRLNVTPDWPLAVDGGKRAA